MKQAALAYLPTGGNSLPFLFVLLAIVWIAGFAITRVRRLPLARALAWALVLIAGATAAMGIAGAEPPGFRMFAIIGAIFLGMKTAVAVEAHAAGVPRLSLVQWLLFTSFFGMRPEIFAAKPSALAGGGALVARGAGWALVGVGVFAIARFTWEHTGSRALATAPLLVAVSLILHFGILNISTGFFRALGYDARMLFPAPLLSQNLAEFWGKRWNLAFSQMTATAVYRPLTPGIGRPAATAAAFLASGLLHEIAISVPVRAGYGLPLLYFCLHGVLLLVERALAARGHAIHGIKGRIWTVVWLAAPMPILFHPAFLRGVLWPLLGAD